jgi:hypothetical protein
MGNSRVNRSERFRIDTDFFYAGADRFRIQSDRFFIRMDCFPIRMSRKTIGRARLANKERWHALKRSTHVHHLGGGFTPQALLIVAPVAFNTPRSIPRRILRINSIVSAVSK